MKNKAKMTLGIIALCSLVGCGEANVPEITPKLSAQQLNEYMLKLAAQDYELAALTGDEDALDRAIEKWESSAKKKDLKAIKSLISFYKDTRNGKKLKYWNDVEILTENEILEDLIKGSLLVGNRSLAAKTSADALSHMQKNLKKVDDLDEKALVKLVNNVITKIDDNDKYPLMETLAKHHIIIDPLKRRETIEKLLNESFAKGEYSANDTLVSYYLNEVKDAQLAKNTLDRHFNPSLSDAVLKALIAKNMSEEAYAFFKKHISKAPDTSMAIICKFYKSDSAKVYELIKDRFLALESWAKSEDFVKYQKNIINYINENAQDGFAHYMAAYTYETSKDYNNGDNLRNHLDKAIELGCTLAYTKLAELYAEGKYVELDYLKAFEFFKKAEIENKEYSIAKQEQLLKRITNFSGKNKVEIATAKLAFYNSLKALDISVIDSYIESAKQEQKTAFVKENSRDLNSTIKRTENNINNLGNAKNALTKLYQKNTSARNLELAAGSYEKALKSLEEEFAKLSKIIEEASSFEIDYFAQIEGLKALFDMTTDTIAKANADLAKIKDGSFASESAAKAILSDPQAKTVKPEIQTNYAIVRETAATLSASQTKLNQLYTTMQRAHKSKKQNEAKALLKEIESVKATIARHDNAIATLSSIGGVDANFINTSKAESKKLSDYVNKLQVEAKKNADSALDSLLNFF